MAGERENQKIDDSRLKICFVAPLPPPYGGIANWMAMMCRYLDEEKRKGIAYEVVNTAPKKRVTEGRTLWQRLAGGIKNTLKNCKQLEEILKCGKIDCVHITTSGSLSLIRDYLVCNVVKKQGIPTIYHVHFGRTPEMRANGSIEWRIFKNILKKVNTVIAIDKKTYDCLDDMEGVSVKYIPNPINMSELPERAKKQKKIVMYLGWVIKEKGIEELLEAWSNFHTRKKEWMLHIVGPCREDYYRYLMGKYSIEGVKFFGEQPHEKAMELLNEASVFILPSYTEGCPYVIMEAMALGKTIIASSVGNIPEMLDGGCGTVVEPKDSKAIENALRDCIGNDEERTSFGVDAMSKVKEAYVIEKIVAEYRDVWEKAYLSAVLPI